MSIRWEMTISRAEFLRTLPAAVAGAQFRVEDDVVRSGDTDRGWQVRIAALPALRIGSLALERHEVEISFDGYSSEEERAFLERFHLCFRRGGG
jgi:hypothetical protein